MYIGDRVDVTNEVKKNRGSNKYLDLIEEDFLTFHVRTEKLNLNPMCLLY